MPFDVLARTPGLVTAAYARLVDAFRDYGHHPSDAQWGAIRDLLDHLERAAHGDLAPALYLSAIPAGTGKSASLASFASALVDSPAYAGVGILIAVNRRTESVKMYRVWASTPQDMVTQAPLHPIHIVPPAVLDRYIFRL